MPWVWAFLARGSARVKDGASSRLGRCKRKWGSASRGWSPAALRAPLGFTTCQRHALARGGGWGGVPLCSGVCAGHPSAAPSWCLHFTAFRFGGRGGRAAPSEAAFSEHPAWVSSAGTIPSLRLAFCSALCSLPACALPPSLKPHLVAEAASVWLPLDPQSRKQRCPQQLFGEGRAPSEAASSPVKWGRGYCAGPEVGGT